MQPNKTKAKLKSGETVFGCFVRYPDASLVEVLGFQDWDFILFDGEHGPLEPHHILPMASAAELRQVTPIVRVPTNQPPVILRFMDTGVQGLHVPLVNSGDDAERAVRSVKYYPRGNRGLAGVRASDYGQTIPFGEYIEQANAETLVVVHIETTEAVERLPEIVEVQGVDVAFIGPTDLSHSLGFPGETGHPTVQATFLRIAEIVKGSDAALGIMVKDAEGARLWRERGARYIAIGLESLLSPAVRDYLKAVRNTDAGS